jgi:regulator of protease activity HflC (stomatin/prohibitin superfamily)
VLFGKVNTRVLTEGIQIINPLVEVQQMSVRTETYTMSATATEGQVRGDDSIQALSSDGLLMPLDITIAFRLVGSDAPRVYRDIGADYVDKIIRPASRTAVREAIAGFTAQEAYSTKREALPQKMHDLMTERMKNLLEQREDFKGAAGFLIDQVMLRNIQLPAKVKNAIEAKLEAAQQAEQMQFVLDKERQEAERKRIEAKGVSDFQTIVSQSINANLLQWKGIEATETLAKSPNAKMVLIGSGKNGLPVILNADKE